MRRQLSIEVPEMHASQALVRAQAARFNCAMMGRRWGKSTLGELLAIETALAGGPFGWFAPGYKFLADPWRNLSRVLAPVVRVRSLQERRLELITGGVIDFWTLEDPNSGRGRKYARAIIDEAGLVRNLEECWTGAIRPTLTDLRGQAWFVGTPKGKRYFWQLWMRGQQQQPGWKSWQLPTSSNPYISPEEIEEARRSMPAAAFRQEFEAVPADDAANPFGLDAIHACVEPLEPGPAVGFGIDLGKAQDFTVVIGFNADRRVCVFDRWQGIPWPDTIDRIVRHIGNARTLVDSTGLGDPVLDDLQRKNRRVEGYQFTRSSKQKLMEGLSVAIQRGDIGYPQGHIVDELEAFEYEYTKTGVTYSAPNGLHDDCVCALSLATHHTATQAGTRVYCSPSGGTKVHAAGSPWGHEGMWTGR